MSDKTETWHLGRETGRKEISCPPPDDNHPKGELVQPRSVCPHHSTAVCSPKSDRCHQLLEGKQTSIGMEAIHVQEH